MKTLLIPTIQVAGTFRWLPFIVVLIYDKPADLRPPWRFSSGDREG